MYLYDTMEELKDIYRIVKTCDDVLCLTMNRVGVMKRVLKIISKAFSFCVLPIITLNFFISIGNIKAQYIIASEGSHRTMTGGIMKIA